jgi:hypothetical protein
VAGPTRANTGRTSTPKRPTTPRRAAPAAPTAPAVPMTGAGSAAAAEPAPEVVARTPIAAPVPVASIVHAAAAQAPVAAAPAPAAREGQALLFGMIVVVAGFVTILIGLAAVLIAKPTSDPTAILGIVTTAIAGLGGAFFGVTVGQQGTATANKERAAAEAAKDEAQMRTIKFAAYMDPAVGRRLVE